MSSNRRSLLLGWYGYDNLGDELLFDVVSETLKESFSKIYYLCNPFAKVEPGSQLTPLKVRGRVGILKLLATIARVDAVVLGGGTYLRDIGAPSSLRFKLLILAWAILLRKDCVIWGGGLGPFSYHKDSKLLRFVLRRIDYVLLRDADSAKEFLNITGKKADIVPDPVFSFASLTQGKPADIRKGVNIGLALREWHDAERNGGVSHYAAFLENLAMYLNSVAELDNLKLTCFSFQESTEDSMSNDSKVYEDLKDKLNKDIEIGHASLDKNISSISSAYQSVDLLIGMRLHSLILAALFNKPVIAISYDPKVNGLMKQLGIEEYSLNFEDVSGAKLEQIYLKLNSQDYSEALEDFLSMLTKYKDVLRKIS